MSSASSGMAQNDRGNAVIAVTSTFEFISLLLIVLRMTTNSLRRRKFGWDDGLMILATVFGLICAICTGSTVANGLDRPIATLQPGILGQYFKLSYVSNIFWVLAIAISKHSLVALVSRVTTSSSPMQSYIPLLHPAIGAWMLFSIFGIAFECDMPMPWVYLPSRCAGRGAIWYPVIIISILLDVILAFGFVPIINGVQIKRKQFEIAGIFSSRVAVVILSIAYIAVLAPALRSADQTQAMTIPSILAQVTLNLSIISATLPALFASITSLERTRPITMISQAPPVNLDQSHSRATSDENNRLRDWALNQVRNSPTPSSFTKEIIVESKDRADKDRDRMSLSPTPSHADDLNSTASGRNSALSQRQSQTLTPVHGHGQARTGSATNTNASTPPTIPPRSARRSVSPQLSRTSPSRSHPEVEKAWFVSDILPSRVQDETIPE